MHQLFNSLPVGDMGENGSLPTGTSHFLKTITTPI